MGGTPELVKPGGCDQKNVPAENVTQAQWCTPEIAEQFREAALDPMAVQVAVQSFRLNQGLLKTSNRFVQFNVTNATNPAANVNYRIGAIGIAGQYQRFNVSAGAADLATMSDNYGANVLMTQGFSQLCQSKGMIIVQIRITSSDPSQLVATTTYNTINHDMTIIPDTVNLASTQNKSDNLTTLMVAYGVWSLDGNHFLNFQSLAGVSMSLTLEVSAMDNVGNYITI